MAGELHLIAQSSGLSVSAHVYLNGSYIQAVALSPQQGGPGSTIYKANFPTGLAAGKYIITYAVDGNDALQGPDTIWWTGTAEVNLVEIAEAVAEIKGTGFNSTTDSLEALSNLIVNSGGDGGGGSSSDEFTTADRNQLGRIEGYAKEASAGAVGSFFTDKGQNTAILLNKDGSEAAAFQLINIDGQPSIEEAVQRQRI